MGFLPALSLILITLKLLGFIQITWLMALVPILLIPAILLAIALVMVVIKLI
jgi:hypothetical protein